MLEKDFYRGPLKLDVESLYLLYSTNFFKEEARKNPVQQFGYELNFLFNNF